MTQLLFPFHSACDRTSRTLRLRLHVLSMSPVFVRDTLDLSDGHFDGQNGCATHFAHRNVHYHWDNDGDFDGHGDNDVTCKQT